jgi:hypothetical protein
MSDREWDARLDAALAALDEARDFIEVYTDVPRAPDCDCVQCSARRRGARSRSTGSYSG